MCGLKRVVCLPKALSLRVGFTNKIRSALIDNKPPGKSVCKVLFSSSNRSLKPHGAHPPIRSFITNGLVEAFAYTAWPPPARLEELAISDTV